MLHRVVSPTNRIRLICISFALLLSGCADEEDRTSSELTTESSLIGGMNNHVAGTYRGSARFLLATDELAYEESRTERVVISIAANGFATIVIGNQSVNTVFDNDQSQSEYRISESVADYRCSGDIPYTLAGNAKQIKANLYGVGECVKGEKKLTVHLTAKVNAVR